ncbi:MAG: hypothetical protein AAFR93_15395, partial [Pseudomonadota bacterium]
MGFVRPEIVEALRARLSHPVEAAILVVLFGLGLWMSLGALSPFSPVSLAVGLGFLGAGLVSARAFGLRARLRRTGGPGVVQVDEGRIAYFGPDGGGFVALTHLMAVDLIGSPQRWVLRNGEGEDVVIPAGADGVAALFDALSGLPGFSPQGALSALDEGQRGLVRV